MHYLKLRADHISMFKAQYEFESPVYYPISNCGDVFYEVYLHTRIVGALIKLVK